MFVLLCASLTIPPLLVINYASVLKQKRQNKTSPKKGGKKGERIGETFNISCRV